MTVFYMYRCDGCHQLGFQKIEDVSDTLTCSVCGQEIGNYQSVDTIEQARVIMASMSQERVRPTRSISRGRGVQARVLDIVECLVDGNRGRPVQVSDVLNECSDADISTERAWHFLNRLEAIERIRLVGKEVTLL